MHFTKKINYIFITLDKESNNLGVVIPFHFKYVGSIQIGLLQSGMSVDKLLTNCGKDTFTMMLAPSFMFEFL